jgi:hypothetical protein
LGVIEKADVAASHGLHHLRQAGGGLGRGQQMKVVVHQHIGVDGNTELAGVLLQQVQHHLVVARRHEDRLAVVAPLDDMVGVARER